MSDTFTKLPDVSGRCPACGLKTLFLGVGGYVTCSLSDCPNPVMASQMLEIAHDIARALIQIRVISSALEEGLELP
jgi:hypothetical protein